MALREPKSMDECVYHTIRSIGEGKVRAWVFKNTCEKCKKGVMAKPKDPKTGKPKIRATEYVCSHCGFSAEKKAYEETLTASVQYICPHCKNKGEIQIPYKRRKIQLINEETKKKKAADALRFQCEKCKENIDITKKLKS